jgi:predicted nucleotidyltransferase
MVFDLKQKDFLKKELVSCLTEDREIRRIVVFGSFLTSSAPADMDVAVFQDSNESYLTLAMKYRKQTRPVSQRIPLDIIPLRNDVSNDPFLKEIESGETVYER